MKNSKSAKLRILEKEELAHISGGEASAGSGVYEASAGSGVYEAGAGSGVYSKR